MELIDKAAVVAEIKRIMAEEMSFFKDSCETELENTSSPVVYTRMEMILSFLDTLEVKEVDLKQKSFVKIDRKLLFEICDAILNHDGYSDVNDCPENDSECFWGKWDEGFRKKVENIRRNS